MSQLVTFVGISAPLILLVLLWPLVSGIAWRSVAWLASGKSTSTANTGTVTGEQAFSAVLSISNYLATAKDDPGYRQIQAAVKTLTAEAS